MESLTKINWKVIAEAYILFFLKKINTKLSVNFMKHSRFNKLLK